MVWPPAFGLTRHSCAHCPGGFGCARTLSEELLELDKEGDIGNGVKAKVELPGTLVILYSAIVNFYLAGTILGSYC